MVAEDGAQIETFASGAEVLAASGPPPAAVLLDLMMPEVDGVAVLKELRRLHPTLPVIILTAVNDVGRAVEVTKLGAYDYLTKPVDQDRLLTTLRRAVSHHSLEQEVEPSPERARRALRTEPDRRLVGRHAEGVRPDRKGARVRHHRLHLRRERHRQGAGRQGDPLRLAALGRPVRGRQLRRHPRGPAGERAVRPREGGVHRRARHPSRQVRAGRRAAPSCSTRSARCRRRPRRGCCGCSRSAACSGSAAPDASSSTSGSSRPPTATSRSWSATAGSARTCTTGWWCSRSSCRRCATRRDDIPALVEHFLGKHAADAGRAGHAGRSGRPRAADATRLARQRARAGERDPPVAAGRVQR